MYRVKSSTQFVDSPADRILPAGEKTEFSVDPGDHLVLLEPEADHGKFPWNRGRSENWRWNVKKFREITKDFLLRQSDAETWEEVQGVMSASGKPGQVILVVGKTKEPEPEEEFELGLAKAAYDGAEVLDMRSPLSKALG